MNYGELKAAIAASSHRNDLAAFIPDFIRRAHDIITDEIALVSDLSLATDTVALPSDFRRVLAVWLQNYPSFPLTEASVDNFPVAGGSGVPRIYRVSGANLLFSPSAQATYGAKLVYRPSKTFFADDDATNTVLTTYPWLYRYGALAELGRHTVDDAMSARYDTMFQADLRRITMASIDDATGGVLTSLPSMVI